MHMRGSPSHHEVDARAQRGGGGCGQQGGHLTPGPPQPGPLVRTSSRTLSYPPNLNSESATPTPYDTSARTRCISLSPPLPRHFHVRMNSYRPGLVCYSLGLVSTNPPVSPLGSESEGPPTPHTPHPPQPTSSYRPPIPPPATPAPRHDTTLPYPLGPSWALPAPPTPSPPLLHPPCLGVPPHAPQQPDNCAHSFPHSSYLDASTATRQHSNTLHSSYTPAQQLHASTARRQHSSYTPAQQLHASTARRQHSSYTQAQLARRQHS